MNCVFSGLTFLVKALFLFTLARSVYAEQPTFWLRGTAFSSTRQLDDVNGTSSQEIGARFDMDITTRQSIKLDARAYTEPSGDDNQLLVDSAYWQYLGNKFTLQMGTQPISFGRADGINPTDYFTGHDYRLAQPFEEDIRGSVNAIKLDQYFSDVVSLSMVVAPDFAPTQIPLPANFDIKSHQPDAWNSPQVALKLDYIGLQWEWSASTFDGYLNMPMWQPNLSENTESPYSLEFVKMRAIGFDGATNIGSYGLRWEAAWWQPDNDSVSLSIPRQLYIVAGGDRVAETWSINFQFIYQQSPDVPEHQENNSLNSFLQSQNQHLLALENKINWGIVTRWAVNNITQTLRAECLLLHYFSPDNGSLRPQIRWSISDKSALTFGAEYQFGDRNTMLGQMRENNTLFVDFKYFLK